MLAQGMIELSVNQGYKSDWSGLFAGADHGDAADDHRLHRLPAPGPGRPDRRRREVGSAHVQLSYPHRRRENDARCCDRRMRVRVGSGRRRAGRPTRGRCDAGGRAGRRRRARSPTWPPRSPRARRPTGRAGSGRRPREIYPALLRAGVRVAPLPRRRADRGAAARARRPLGRAARRWPPPGPGCTGAPVPPDPPPRRRRPAGRRPGRALRRPCPAPRPPPAPRCDALTEVYADQRRPHRRDRAPGPVPAAGGRRVGRRADRAPRWATPGCPGAPTSTTRCCASCSATPSPVGGPPRRLAELAAQIAEAFGVRAPAPRLAGRGAAGVRPGRHRRCPTPGPGCCAGSTTRRCRCCWSTRSSTGSGRRTAGPGATQWVQRRAGSARSTCRAASSPAAGPPGAAARCRSPRWSAARWSPTRAGGSWSPTPASWSRACSPRSPATPRLAAAGGAGDLYAALAARRVRRRPGPGQGRAARRDVRPDRRRRDPGAGRAAAQLPDRVRVRRGGRPHRRGRRAGPLLAGPHLPAAVRPAGADVGLDPAEEAAGRGSAGGAAGRARGRFTRNFVIQATAAEWALDAARRRCAPRCAGTERRAGLLPARRGGRALPGGAGRTRWPQAVQPARPSARPPALRRHPGALPARRVGGGLLRRRGLTGSGPRRPSPDPVQTGVCRGSRSMSDGSAGWDCGAGRARMGTACPNPGVLTVHGVPAARRMAAGAPAGVAGRRSPRRPIVACGARRRTGGRGGCARRAVLAAGGRPSVGPKALLTPRRPVAGRPRARRAAEAGCAPVVVVLGAGRDAGAARRRAGGRHRRGERRVGDRAWARRCGPGWPRWRDTDAEAVVVLLVDMPGVTAEAVRRVAALPYRQALVCATYERAARPPDAVRPRPLVGHRHAGERRRRRPALPDGPRRTRCSTWPATGWPTAPTSTPPKRPRPGGSPRRHPNCPPPPSRYAASPPCPDCLDGQDQRCRTVRLAPVPRAGPVPRAPVACAAPLSGPAAVPTGPPAGVPGGTGRAAAARWPGTPAG